MYSPVSLLVVVLALMAPAQTQRSEKEGQDQAFDQCAKACNNCERVCEGCAAHCGMMIAQGKKEHLRTLDLPRLRQPMRCCRCHHGPEGTVL